MPLGNPSAGPLALGRLLPPMRGSWKDECRVWVRETGTSALSMQALGDVSAEGWGRVVLLSWRVVILLAGSFRGGKKKGFIYTKKK